MLMLPGGYAPFLGLGQLTPYASQAYATQRASLAGAPQPALPAAEGAGLTLPPMMGASPVVPNAFTPASARGAGGRASLTGLGDLSGTLAGQIGPASAAGPDLDLGYDLPTSLDPTGRGLEATLVGGKPGPAPGGWPATVPWRPNTAGMPSPLTGGTPGVARSSPPGTWRDAQGTLWAIPGGGMEQLYPVKAPPSDASKPRPVTATQTGGTLGASDDDNPVGDVLDTADQGVSLAHRAAQGARWLQNFLSQGNVLDPSVFSLIGGPSAVLNPADFSLFADAGADALQGLGFTPSMLGTEGPLLDTLGTLGGWAPSLGALSSVLGIGSSLAGGNYAQAGLGLPGLASSIASLAGTTPASITALGGAGYGALGSGAAPTLGPMLGAIGGALMIPAAVGGMILSNNMAQSAAQDLAQMRETQDIREGFSRAWPQLIQGGTALDDATRALIDAGALTLMGGEGSTSFQINPAKLAEAQAILRRAHDVAGQGISGGAARAQFFGTQGGQQARIGIGPTDITPFVEPSRELEARQAIGLMRMRDLLARSGSALSDVGWTGPQTTDPMEMYNTLYQLAGVDWRGVQDHGDFDPYTQTGTWDPLGGQYREAWAPGFYEQNLVNLLREQNPTGFAGSRLAQLLTEVPRLTLSTDPAAQEQAARTLWAQTLPAWEAARRAQPDLTSHWNLAHLGYVPASN